MGKYTERLQELDRTGPEKCLPAGSLEGSEAEELLEEAERSFPDSDYVYSVWSWFEDKGFITEAQAAVLRYIRDEGDEGEEKE